MQCFHCFMLENWNLNVLTLLSINGVQLQYIIQMNSMKCTISSKKMTIVWLLIVTNTHTIGHLGDQKLANPRITGGWVAKRNAYPFMIHLKVLFDKVLYLCGGVLIGIFCTIAISCVHNYNYTVLSRHKCCSDCSSLCWQTYLNWSLSWSTQTIHFWKNSSEKKKCKVHATRGMEFRSKGQWCCFDFSWRTISNDWSHWIGHLGRNWAW